MKKQSNWSKLSSGTLILVLFCGDFRRCIFDKITPDGVDVLVYNRVYYRKLTPLECERLQTVPDNYTNHVSNSQRYKMLGNG